LAVITFVGVMRVPLQPGVMFTDELRTAVLLSIVAI
jgi:hypothetical protein